jgi:hypothetical protein
MHFFVYEQETSIHHLPSAKMSPRETYIFSLSSQPHVKGGVRQGSGLTCIQIIPVRLLQLQGFAITSWVRFVSFLPAAETIRFRQIRSIATSRKSNSTMYASSYEGAK